MTMVTYIYKSQWLAAYTHFLMKNGEKTAGKQHIQKIMVIKIYIQKTIVIKIYNQLHKTTTTNAIDN